MKIYKVDIARVEYRVHTFTVTANSEEEAEDKAKEQALDNTDWKLVSVEEFVNDVEKTTTTKENEHEEV
jgi:hypothetical protein